MATNAVEVALHRALERLRAQLGVDSERRDVRVRPVPAGLGPKTSIATTPDGGKDR